MHKAHHARPRRGLCLGPDARATRGNAAIGRGRGRLCDHQAGTAHGARTQMHQVPIIRQPVDGAVLAHGGHDDAIRQVHVTQLVRHECWHFGRGYACTAAAQRVMRRGPPHQLGIALLQVLVGDALAARHQVEGELDRILIHVAFRVLEPLETRLCSLLQLEHVHLARLFIGAQRPGHILATMTYKGLAQRDRIFHRELCA